MIKEILLLCLYLIGFVYFYLNIRKGYLEMDPCDYIYCEGWERIFETLIAGVFWPVWFPISLIILIAIKIIYYCDKIKPPKWLILICLISFI